MLINIAIICLIQSTLAIFHHKTLPHTRVCVETMNNLYVIIESEEREKNYHIKIESVLR